MTNTSGPDHSSEAARQAGRTTGDAPRRDVAQRILTVQEAAEQRFGRVAQESGQGVMKVADVMSRIFKLANPEDTVQQAARLMADQDTGALPVGENDRLVGMVTDRDLAVRAAAAGKDPAKTKLREVMSGEPRYVFEDEPVERAAASMAEQQVQRLPVLDRDKRLVGILSLGDLAHFGAAPSDLLQTLAPVLPGLSGGISPGGLLGALLGQTLAAGGHGFGGVPVARFPGHSPSGVVSGLAARLATTLPPQGMFESAVEQAGEAEAMMEAWDAADLDSRLDALLARFESPALGHLSHTGEQAGEAEAMMEAWDAADVDSRLDALLARAADTESNLDQQLARLDADEADGRLDMLLARAADTEARLDRQIARLDTGGG